MNMERLGKISGRTVVQLAPGNQSRNLLVEKNSVAEILVPKQTGLQKLELQLQAGAGVHLILHGVCPSSKINCRVEKNARLTITLLGRQQKNYTIKFNVDLIGERSDCHLQLALVDQNNGHGKVECLINHQAVNTVGRIISRRILQQEATGAFACTLKVGREAHGTDTYLSDKAVLVGEKSKATSDPRMEILTNNVKASHGVTIGQLSPEEFFYLRSRGIWEEQALLLLLKAFLKPALVGVDPKLQGDLI
ncbi:MAG: SufD family Fe-S cluster assembly protein [Patescibacteria group bacterium]